MTTKPISGQEWITHVVKCLGLEHLRVRRVVIDAAYDSAVEVYVECFGSEELLDVEPPEAGTVSVRVIE